MANLEYIHNLTMLQAVSCVAEDGASNPLKYFGNLYTPGRQYISMTSGNAFALTFDLGTNFASKLSNCDTFVIHTTDYPSITPVVEWSTDNVSYTGVILTQVGTNVGRDNSCQIFTFTAPGQKRYWRVQIPNDGDNITRLILCQRWAPNYHLNELQVAATTEAPVERRYERNTIHTQFQRRYTLAVDGVTDTTWRTFANEIYKQNQALIGLWTRNNYHLITLGDQLVWLQNPQMIVSNSEKQGSIKYKLQGDEEKVMRRVTNPYGVN